MWKFFGWPRYGALHCKKLDTISAEPLLVRSLANFREALLAGWVSCEVQRNDVFCPPLISKYFTQIRQKERILHFSSIQIHQVTSKSVHYPTEVNQRHFFVSFFGFVSCDKSSRVVAAVTLDRIGCTLEFCSVCHPLCWPSWKLQNALVEKIAYIYCKVSI